MPASKNQIVVYQPNETVRLDVFYDGQLWDARALVLKLVAGVKEAA